MGAMTPMVLSADDKRKWHDTMTLMTWKCPGFRHLFYRLLCENKGQHQALFTEEVPTAATDGSNIMANPGFLFGLTLNQRLFVMAHEIMHNVYDDVTLINRCARNGTVPMTDGSTLPFRESIMQAAMDYRINALLVESRIGTMPDKGWYDPAIAVGHDSVLDVYKKVWEDDDKNPGKYGADMFDQVMPGGTSTGKAPTPRNQQQWQIEVAAAKNLEMIRSAGKGSPGLMRMFDDIINPEVPWTDHIQGIFNRRVGSGSYTWKRPDRRFIVRDIVMPGRSGKGAGWLVAWGDSSGSIGTAEMERYLGELAGIIEDVRPQRLTVVWCDDTVHHVDELSDAADLRTLQARGAGGGGGTDVNPVFAWIADQQAQPEMFIGFTDGCFTFPDSPPWPVIWASTTAAKYPFGDVVRIHPKGAMQ